RRRVAPGLHGDHPPYRRCSIASRMRPVPASGARPRDAIDTRSLLARKVMESPDPAAEDGVVEGIPHPTGICWSAVFAGLVVGVRSQLLLMPSGSAAALPPFGSGLPPVDNNLLITSAVLTTAIIQAGRSLDGIRATCRTGPRRPY